MLKISVAIPCYNAADFIETTIQSILHQDYPNIECIVVDGGSSDGTTDILARYNDKITWVTETDMGQSDAINKGLKLATGDIVAELDADDIYERDAFKKVAAFFEQNPDARWVYGKCRNIDGSNREIRKPITWTKNYFSKRYSYNKLLVSNFIPQPAVFWRRELMDEMGLFDVNEHLVMDYEYWLRCGARYAPGYIDDYLAGWRIHPSSKSSRNYITEHREALNIARKYASATIPIIFHYLVYFFMVAAYGVTSAASRLRRR